MQRKISEWVLDTAASRERELSAHRTASRPERYRCDIQIEGLNLTLTRWYLRGENSSVAASRWEPEDLDKVRFEEIIRALKRKTPKLERWRRDKSRCCLILESRDIVL